MCHVNDHEHLVRPFILHRRTRHTTLALLQAVHAPCPHLNFMLTALAPDLDRLSATPYSPAAVQRTLSLACARDRSHLPGRAPGSCAPSSPQPVLAPTWCRPLLMGLWWRVPVADARSGLGWVLRGHAALHLVVPWPWALTGRHLQGPGPHPMHHARSYHHLLRHTDTTVP